MVPRDVLRIPLSGFFEEEETDREERPRLWLPIPEPPSEPPRSTEPTGSVVVIEI